jgi:hypothetical protein
MLEFLEKFIGPFRRWLTLSALLLRSPKAFANDRKSLDETDQVKAAVEFLLAGGAITGAIAYCSVYLLPERLVPLTNVSHVSGKDLSTMVTFLVSGVMLLPGFRIFIRVPFSWKEGLAYFGYVYGLFSTVFALVLSLYMAIFVQHIYRAGDVEGCLARAAEHPVTPADVESAKALFGVDISTKEGVLQFCFGDAQSNYLTPSHFDDSWWKAGSDGLGIIFEMGMVALCSAISMAALIYSANVLGERYSIPGSRRVGAAFAAIGTSIVGTIILAVILGALLLFVTGLVTRIREWL